ncbi:hypothetical protein VNO77_10256 [Canavalia gladiata]|uniref:Uncharacterized protein n=1 Tax=Canavalia gladiata TaxID=3824 RepID=A0AAN9MFN8_CANGL
MRRRVGVKNERVKPIWALLWPGGGVLVRDKNVDVLGDIKYQHMTYPMMDIPAVGSVWKSGDAGQRAMP